jgi:Family of unknown function (DUF5662)
MPSDFVKDLIDHKQRVAGYMQIVANELFRRAAIHDNSKFLPEEFEIYEQVFPELQKHAFGSAQMKAAYEQLGPALEHHFQVNRHHPEYFEHGIDDMNLIDILEMVCDWCAASARSQTGIQKGLLLNKQKFKIDDRVFGMIERTVVELMSK